jgi:hypothetical protein
MIIRMEYILRMKDAVDALMALDCATASFDEIARAKMIAVPAEVALKRIMREIGEMEAEVVS